MNGTWTLPLSGDICTRFLISFIYILLALWVSQPDDEMDIEKKRSWGFIRWWNGKTTESSSNTNELAQGHTYIYFFLHMKSSGNITITSVFSERSTPAVMSKKIDSVAAGPLHLVYLSPRAFSAAVTCLRPRLCLTLSFSPLGFCCISWSLSPS